MKKSKTKLIVIISIIVVLAVIAGVGAFLYFTTDLFKSNQELFYKYIAQNTEVLNLLQKDVNEQAIDTMLAQSKYETKGTVNFQLTSSDTQIANQAIPPRNFTIDYTGKTDGLNRKASSQATLKFLSKDLFTIKYIQDEDRYGITSDEVINKYMVLDNNKLNELAKKLGDNQNTYPDKIESIDRNQLLAFSQSDQQTLQKYIEVINMNLSKDAFTKRKDVTINVDGKDLIANEYGITLTDAQLVEIQKSILTTLKQDDATLNMLIARLTTVSGETIDLQAVKEKIQNAMDHLSQAENKDTMIQILVYESEGKVVKTRVENSETGAIVLDIARGTNAKRAIITFEYNYENMGVNTTQENQKVLIKSIEIAKKSLEAETETDYIVTIEKGDDITKIAFQDKVTNNLANGETTRELIANIDFSNVTYFTTKAVLSSKLVDTIDIEKLTDQNSAVINNFTPEYAKQLLTAITNRLGILYNQKMQAVTVAQQEQNATNNTTNQENTNTITEPQTQNQ